MAVTATHLTAGNAASGTSGNTASITPVANEPVIITIFNNNGAGTQNVPTVSGCGLTWTQIRSKKSVSQSFLTETMILGVGASPSAGAITIDFAGQNQASGFMWNVDRFSNTATSSHIKQSADNDANTTQTGITVTLSSFASVNNATYAVVGWGAATAVTQKAGFTELVDSNLGNGQLEAQFLATADTTPSWTWSSANNWSLGMAVEISIPVVPSGNFFQFFM